MGWEKWDRINLKPLTANSDEPFNGKTGLNRKASGSVSNSESSFSLSSSQNLSQLPDSPEKLSRSGSLFAKVSYSKKSKTGLKRANSDLSSQPSQLSGFAEDDMDVEKKEKKGGAAEYLSPALKRRRLNNRAKEEEGIVKENEKEKAKKEKKEDGKTKSIFARSTSSSTSLFLPTTAPSTSHSTFEKKPSISSDQSSVFGFSALTASSVVVPSEAVPPSKKKSIFERKK